MDDCGSDPPDTLVLVHRRQLLDQWRERLSIFLNLPLKSIGQIETTKKIDRKD